MLANKTDKDSVKEYLENRVNKYSPIFDTDCCWFWSRGVNTSGYGHIGPNRISAHYGVTTAHKLSYLVHNGEVPEGQCVLHTCDNKICINPNHLFLGTHQDNMDDMVRKGRSDTSSGEDHPMSVLSTLDVLRIRDCKDHNTSVELSRMFDVSPRTIRDIWNRHTWKDV
jgi:hypothetical protein